jgi:hypothetical protein
MVDEVKFLQQPFESFVIVRPEVFQQGVAPFNVLLASDERKLVSFPS